MSRNILMKQLVNNSKSKMVLVARSILIYLIYSIYVLLVLYTIMRLARRWKSANSKLSGSISIMTPGSMECSITVKYWNFVSILSLANRIHPNYICIKNKPIVVV